MYIIYIYYDFFEILTMEYQLGILKAAYIAQTWDTRPIVLNNIELDFTRDPLRKLQTMSP